MITPEAVLSFPALFEPQKASEDADPKYGASLIFTAEAQETPQYKALKRAVVETAKERWGDKAVQMIKKGKLNTPFRDGEDKSQYGYPEDSKFINAKSNRKPGIVSTIPDPNNGGKPMVIDDEAEIYAGCIVRADVVPFAYDVSGNKGVSFGLNNLQKIRDGERLDSYVPAEDVFEADEDATADLSDLEEEDTDETEDGEDPLEDLVG